MNSILMRNTEVVEQPIRLQHNLTQRLVNESVHFLEEHARNSSPFLLVISWVQVHCISLLLHSRFKHSSLLGVLNVSLDC